MASESTTPKKPHISHLPFTWDNWYQHINWFNTIQAIFVPLAAFAGAYFVPLHTYTAVFALIYYFNSGLGVTAGYHRLWSHTSFKASLPLQLYLLAVGAGAVQGSAYYWSRTHRAHHRYTDTEKDPYAVRKGLLYAHIGWVVLKQDSKEVGRADISDLNQDRLVVWQHRNYFPVAIFMGYVFPVLVCGLWGDMLGGFVYAGILRCFFVQQGIFCLNSLAHWLGEQPFDDRHTPRDNWFTALVTLGDGYHNFHHEFPSDYRNAIKWYQYDPTKWMIWMWKRTGLASDLKQFRANEIQKGRVQQLQKVVDQQHSGLDWGVPLDQLPVLSWDDYVAETEQSGKALVVIAGVIHDVTDFIRDHPGGKALISSGIGKDATAMFNGGVYDHSNAAHNLLSTMRVGVLLGGAEVEIWKRAQSEKTKMSAFIRAGDQVTKVTRRIEIAGAM